jgi:DNA (cytosine-5)-methyltransferase 1
LRVFSTFSGISAATAAWKDLGWTFAGYADYEPSACAVLATRCGATRPKYLPTIDPSFMEDDAWGLTGRINEGIPAGTLPARLLNYLTPGMNPLSLTPPDIRKLRLRDDEKFEEMFERELERRQDLITAHKKTEYPVTGTTPNFGDLWYVTDADLEDLGPIDLLEGGSPCQAFSAAGKKEGLLDYRSAGLFGFIDLIERMKRINGLKWVLWENVKGVLNDSQNGFGYLLGRIAQTQGAPVVAPGGRYTNAGYVSGPDGDVAWRLLDAKYFGKPNRRERVFALAHVGDGAAGIDPREILFDEECKELRPHVRARKGKASVGIPGACVEEISGYRGPVAFMAGQSAKVRSAAESTTVVPTLRSGESGTNQVPSIAYVIPTDGEDGTKLRLEDIDPNRLAVRKLLPEECERLMGFPEGWTDVELNGAPMADSARYKCIGNSMSVDIMRWIGRRLDEAEEQALAV